MSNTVKPLYGSSGQALTCTLASLATNAARGALAVDNSAALLLDALVFVQVKTGGSSAAVNGYVNVYAYGSNDGGTTYPEGAGTDVGITLISPPNVRLIGTFTANANSTTFKSPLMSVAAAFGGVLPQFWGIIIENQSGTTLDGTEGNHKKLYQGVQLQAV